MLKHASSPASKIYTLVTRDVLPRVRLLLADKEQVTLNSLRVLAILVSENQQMPFPRCLFDLQFCPLLLPLLIPAALFATRTCLQWCALCSHGQSRDLWLQVRALAECEDIDPLYAHPPPPPPHPFFTASNPFRSTVATNLSSAFDASEPGAAADTGTRQHW